MLLQPNDSPHHHLTPPTVQALKGLYATYACRTAGKRTLHWLDRTVRCVIGIAVAMLLCLPPAQATDFVTISSKWSQDLGRPGDVADLAIVLSIASGYHINPDAQQIEPMPGFTPYPTSVQVITADKRLDISSAIYPPAHLISANYAGTELPAFEGNVTVYMPVKIREGSPTGDASIRLRVRFQACDDHNCYIPETVHLDTKLPIVSPDRTVRHIHPELFASRRIHPKPPTDELLVFRLFKWSLKIDAASFSGPMVLLVMAALGGMLLNFTPCVLPLIPIKIMSLSNAAQNRQRCLTLGLCMSAGIIAFWLILALMIALISDFSATNQLFHYPPFTIAVGGVIAAMAVSMCGLFTISPPQFLYRFDLRQETLSGSFGLGIMTAILSTPCTAPFMGTAAAWAATQNPASTLSTFAAIGAGMALPYLILSAAPRLVKRMPRSGPAGVLIKQVMGILILAAAAYFIGSGLSAWLTVPPDSPGKGFWWIVLGFSWAAGLWLIYRTAKIAARTSQRIIFMTVGLFMLAVSWWGITPLIRSGPVDWINYTPQRFETALKQGNIVVLDFTAEWCLNCKAIEASVLNSPRVSRLLDDEDIAPIKVDLTVNNPDGKTKLRQTGHLTIPLLVIYAPSGQIVFKSDYYTAHQIERAIQKVRDQDMKSKP